MSSDNTASQVTYRLGRLLTSNLDPTDDAGSANDSVTTGSIFTIDSKSGWITTRAQMDHETCSSYSFEVVASDSGESKSLSSTAVVTVTVSDVNDNPPRFKEELYMGSVTESDPLGEVVAVLGTEDRDGTDPNRQVSFYITGEGTWEGFFFFFFNSEHNFQPCSDIVLRRIIMIQKPIM